MNNDQNKLKILYLITQSELGGAGRYVVDLVTHLGDDFESIVAFGEQGEMGELATLLKPTNAVYYALPHLKRSINPYHDLLAFFEIVSLIRRLRPDIVHLNSSKISILGTLAVMFVNTMRRGHMRNYKNAKNTNSSTSQFVDSHSFVDSHPSSQFVDSHPAQADSHPIRVIYTVHGWVFNEPLPGWLKTFYYYAEKLTASLKDKLICICQFDLDAAREMKIPIGKLALVPNGRAPVAFLPPAEARSSLASSLPVDQRLDDSIPLIGTIGNLYRTKGFTHLLDAIRMMNDQGASVRLEIIGEGDERPVLEERIARLGLQGSVILAGRIDKAATLLPSFDIYVCSSVKEGLSYTIIEAMQAGLPIVATEVGGNPDLIEDKVSGLLVPPADPSALATAISSLLADRALATCLGEAAQTKALRNFTLDKMVEETKKIYRSPTV